MTSVSMTFEALNHVLTLSKCWLIKQHCCSDYELWLSSHSMLDTDIPHLLLWLRNRERHWFKVTPLCHGGTLSPYQELLRTLLQIFRRNSKTEGVWVGWIQVAEGHTALRWYSFVILFLKIQRARMDQERTESCFSSSHSWKRNYLCQLLQGYLKRKDKVNLSLLSCAL